MDKKKIMAVVCIAGACCSIVSSCGKSDDEDVPNPQQGEQTQGNEGSASMSTAGSDFLSRNLKIQSKIVDSSVSPSRDIVIELYVDGNGNGEGMLGFGETVCDVKVVRDKLYILVDETTVVCVDDLSGRCVLNPEEIAEADDLESCGFQLVSGVPVAYSVRVGSLLVNTAFAQSSQMFEEASLSTESVMGLQDAINYITDFNTAKALGANTTDESKEVESFYLNSNSGVTIEGKVYSVGDTCNPSTYFGGRTPEGLLTSSEYKEDVRVDFLHASYISDTGRTTFTLAGNYVQSIETNTKFKWLGLEQGMDPKELKTALGWNLTTKEKETWKPISKYLSVSAYNRNTYFCTLGNLEVQLRVDNKEGLKSIYIARPLEYRSDSK